MFTNLTQQKLDRALRALQVTARTRGVRIVQDQVRRASPPPVNTEAYRQAWKAADLERGAVIYNALPYAAVIEHGRRPGARMPPVSALVPWVMRKLKVKGEGAARGIAFVIARRIAQRGLPARGILAAAKPAINAAVNAAVRKAIYR
jgi:hypothetical protein